MNLSNEMSPCRNGEENGEAKEERRTHWYNVVQGNSKNVNGVPEDLEDAERGTA